MGIRKRLAFQAFSTGMGLAAMALARGASTRGWKLAARKDPPLNPASRKTSWKSALGFAAFSGATAAVMGVVGRRAAAGVWRRRVGKLPVGTR